MTLLAGFLGSGKTTLVNRLLAERHGERIAVVVNEFGDVGIDGSLVVGATDEIVELANGCICCTVRGDLVETLGRLVARRRRPRLFGGTRFDRVVIEASGLASPGPAVQTLLLDPELASHLELAGVVGMAHAARIAEQLAEHPEAGEQIAYSDLIVLNHVDRADASALERAEERLRAVNGVAPIVRSERASVDVGRALDPGRVVDLATIETGASTDHTCGITTIALESDQPVDLHRLKMWLAFLVQRRGQELMRMKGILACPQTRSPVVVQSVYQWLEIGPGEGEPPSSSRLVAIGRDLDRVELERGWSSLAQSRA